jgi:DNA-directed RNA polymerase specialized sigma24 family protein
MSPTPFPNTRWTLLQKLRDGSEADAHAALNTLCHAYWTPLYAVARYERMSEHDAQDAVQGFFLTMLRKETFAKADAAQGKLRSLLLKSFSNYCISEWRREQTQKRGDGAEHVPLHDVGGTENRVSKELQADGLSAEKLYAREWARTVLDHSLEALRQHYTERGKDEQFALLRGSLMQEDDAGKLDQLAATAGMTSGALRVALHRMRAQYRERIEHELSVTLDTTDPAVIQAEIGELFRAFD